jgi:hypothetical protein
MSVVYPFLTGLTGWTGLTQSCKSECISCLKVFHKVKHYVVFTDLDGTLLDHDTYGWEEALPALERCKRLLIPIVLVSSKTRAEMDQLRIKLSISAPFISENGGGIFSPMTPRRSRRPMPFPTGICGNGLSVCLTLI